jgi:hypothetical protein
MLDTDPETCVLAAWYLAAHEWGHYYLAKASKRNQERDADAFVIRIMKREGFSEDEAAGGEDAYWKVFFADKKSRSGARRG